MFNREKELLANKRQREITEYLNSNIFKEVVGKIAEKIKAQRIIAEESFDEKRIFRAQGAIKMAISILDIPNKLGEK